MVRYGRIAIIASAVYVAAVAGLSLFQRTLIYAPDHSEYLPPSHYAMLDGVKEIALSTPDDLELTAWYAPPPGDRPTVLILPGKSGSLRTQRHRITQFRAVQLGVLLVAWRGYSGNPGSPSEDGLYDDARAALDWLEAHGVADRSIVLYGISLGSGVATRMAAERDVGGVILEAPYTSLVDVARHRYPIVPVCWLLRDRFDSLSRIAALNAPLLVMHGDGDKVIPQHFGRRLYDAARAPKQGFWPAGVGHNDIFDRGGYAAAIEFIESSVEVPTGHEPSQAAVARLRRMLPAPKASIPAPSRASVPGSGTLTTALNELC